MKPNVKNKDSQGQLKRDLFVSQAWVTKAQLKLGIQWSSGKKGSISKFTEQQKDVFRIARALTMCGYSWPFVKEHFDGETILIDEVVLTKMVGCCTVLKSAIKMYDDSVEI